MNCQPVHRVLGLGRIASCSAAWSGIWEQMLTELKTTENLLYVVRDEDPLVVVGELLEVGGGAVPALRGAVVTEGDGAAGPGVDVALDPGHHLVIRL